MARNPHSRDSADSTFCGASGTSALNASLTSPGAESTIDLNRGGRLAPPQSNQADPTAGRGELLQMPTPSKPEADAPSGAVAEEHPKAEETSRTDVVAQPEMVPDVPLSEYISHFHYEPPAESEATAASGEAGAPNASPSDSEAAVPTETSAVANDSQYFSLTGEAVAAADSAQKVPFEIRVHLHRRQDLWLATLTIAAVVGVGAIAWYARARQAKSPAPTASATKTSATLAAPAASSSENTPTPADQRTASAQQSTEQVSQAANSESQTEITQKPKPVVAPPPPTKAEAGRSHDVEATPPTAHPHTNPDSPVVLANKYLKGDGVARDCNKAIALLKAAAAKANVRACNQLASMYAIGSCVQRDRVQAYHWLNAALAADPGNEWAQHNRDLMSGQMTPAERSEVQASR